MLRIKRSAVTIAPAVEPVTDEEVSLQAKLDEDTTEADLRAIYIPAARERVENRIQQSLITQTRVMKLDYFPRCGHFDIPMGPVQSVVITYTDEDGNPQTLNANDYWVDTRRVTIKNYWPGTYTMPNAVTVTYVAGFGALATDVPAPLRTAILMRVTHMIENRQSVSPANNYEVPLGEDDLIENYIVEQDAFY